MIIRQKKFPNKKVYEIDYCGRPLRMEVGRMAELANAAVLVQYCLLYTSDAADD